MAISESNGIVVVVVVVVVKLGIVIGGQPHYEIQAIHHLHSRSSSVCLWNVDDNESTLEETGILSSVLSKKDSRHQVVWLHHECWGFHQIGSTEYPVDGSPAQSFSVQRVACDVRDSSTLPKLMQTVGSSSHYLAAPDLFRLRPVSWRRPQLCPGSGRVENVRYGNLALRW